MQSDRWRRIEELFEGALELAPAERAPYLEAQCGADLELRQEVESLLAADDEAAEGHLEDAVRRVAAEVVTSQKPAAEGERIGAYRIVRPLGEGGMGAVFLAERADQEYESQVAIKVLRGGGSRPELVTRFRSERQILANLHHPYIAQLLDAGGTDRGDPYVVMEYVRGEPLDQYCDRKRLKIAGRVDLFHKVCDAVHCAHQNLVVHRDLKPGNILVTDEGDPKLLDFGIAKILDDGPQQVDVTGPLGRVMTPQYASPEQVLGKPVTVASDVYSLGVVLYELLSSRPPYQLGAVTPAKLERLVCELDPPPPSEMVLGEVFAANSRGGQSPEKISHELTGELDDIVLMAMSKKPEERYPSVERFAADLRRYREGYPVMARKQTFAYRSGKLLRRYWVAASAAAAFVLLLIAFAVSMATAAARIARERDAAEQEREKAQQVSTFLADIFRITDPGESRGERVAAREILDWGARRVRLELADQPEVQAELMDTMGRVYQNLGIYGEAEQLVEDALDRRLSLFGENHIAVASSLNHLGELRRLMGRYDDAEQLFTRALDLSRRLSYEDDAAVSDSLNGLAMAAREKGEYVLAERLARETLELRRSLYGGEHSAISAALHNLGTVLYRKGSYADAEDLFREALAMDRSLLGEKHPDVATSLSSLGAVLRRTGRLDEAQDAFEEALGVVQDLYGAEHVGVANGLRNLSETLSEQGRYSEAQERLEEALRLDRELLGDDHPDVAVDLNSLALLLQRRGRLTDAEKRFDEALELRRRILPQGHPRLANSLIGLGSLVANSGRPVEAQPLLEEALTIFSNTLPPGHWQVAEARTFLALCLALQAKYDAAEQALQAAPEPEALESLPGPQRRQRLQILVYLYDAWGKPQRAAAYQTQLEEL